MRQLTLEGGQASVSEIAAEVQRDQPDESVPELRVYACNATIESGVKATWKRIVDDFEKVDVLVTSAGIVDNVEAENYDFPRRRKMMDINVDV
jgi:NAD(P)-dependent dehydrogenase (short-subunit alcohol dehydrogenase family)